MSSPLLKKMLQVDPVLHFLSIMPIDITYQALSMYQTLCKAL